jgi:phenylacetate-CoA ligase
MLKDLAKKLIVKPNLLLETGGEQSLQVDSFVRKVNSHIRHYAIEQSDYFDEDDWRDIQLSKLKHILEHAASSVPYWNEKFKAIGFNPARLESLEDIRNIPIVTRKELKKIAVDRLLSSTVPHYRAVKFATSGSTGEPFLFYRDAYQIITREEDVVYEFRLAGADNQKPLLIIGLPTHIWLDRWGTRFNAEYIYNAHLRKNILYPYIEREKPLFLYGSPALLSQFADLAAKDHRHFSFEIVKYIGESMEDSMKEMIQNVLGGVICGSYGAKECSLIAAECRKGRYHLLPWLNVIEVADSEGHSVAPGSEGRLIVTNLENEVMPFIRYDIGDRGMLHPDPCSCGMKTSTITFTGRDSGMIELPSGEAIMVLYVLRIIAEKFHSEILRFQTEHRSPTEIVFRFVPSEKFSEKSEKKLKELFDGMFKKQITCILERTDNIFPNKEGKIPLFIESFKAE